jgi:hypothetical protein
MGQGVRVGCSAEQAKPEEPRQLPSPMRKHFKSNHFEADKKNEKLLENVIT